MKSNWQTAEHSPVSTASCSFYGLLSVRLISTSIAFFQAAPSLDPLEVKISSLLPLALAGWPSARDPDGRDDRGRQPLPSPLTSPPLPTSRCLLFLSESKNRSWCEPAPSQAQRLKIKRKCGEAAETVTGLGTRPGSNRTLRALPGGQEPRGGDGARRVHWHTSHVTRHTSHEEGCGEALTRWGRQKQAGRI